MNAVEEENIVGSLIERVQSLPPGAKAPSESDIMAEFDVSRSRARSVLRRLESAWLLRRVQGAGTFVSRPIEYPVSLDAPPSLREILSAAGAEVHTVMLGVDPLPAPGGVADWLGIDEGTTVQRVRRLGYVDDEPAVLLEEYLPPGRLEQVSLALPIYRSMAELLRTDGCEPVRTAGRGTVVVPSHEVSLHLNLPLATPAWRLDTQLRDERDGRILLMSRSWSRLDVIRLVFEFGDMNSRQ